MKKFTSKDLLALVIWVLPAAYLLSIYPSLPQTVPLHFGMDGQPDRFGDRSAFTGCTNDHGCKRFYVFIDKVFTFY
jgi:uncharacterized membrane protein